jgi:hypothetical protein
MGAVRQFTPVKLFIGVLVSNRKFIASVEERLAALYGKVDHRSDVIPFDFTDYYEKEMGDILDRVFFSFERLIEADRLPEIKRQTNELEDELAELLRTPNTTIKRPVNLDPGYVEQAKVVLASTKNFYHRIYIGRGIFAEVTMHFKNNTYQFFPWTYPDYQSRDYQEFFLRTRQIFRSQLRTMCIVDNNVGRGGTGQM